MVQYEIVGEKREKGKLQASGRAWSIVEGARDQLSKVDNRLNIWSIKRFISFIMFEKSKKSWFTYVYIDYH